MRRAFGVAVLVLMVMGGCGSDPTDTATETTPAVEAPSTPDAVETLEPSPTAEPTLEPTATPESAPDIEAPDTPEEPMTVGSPSYLVAGPEGVFRVVDGVRTRVADRSDVQVALDDGAGGVVTYAFVADTATVEHLTAGATEPVVLATDVTPVFTTWLAGRPTLALNWVRTGTCEDADAFDFVLVDLPTGDSRVYQSCIPLETGESPPSSMGGKLAVSVAYSGWPEDEPISSGIVFRGMDGDEIDVAANPWSQRCRWCELHPRLSPGGTMLIIAEYTPSPTDLGANSWDDVAALPLDEQWRRWDQARPSGAFRLRLVDLDTGATIYTQDQAMPLGRTFFDDFEFDGRYVLWSSLDTGEVHLIDTVTGDETAVDTGGAVRLMLPSNPPS